jgi:hypothetical protein
MVHGAFLCPTHCDCSTEGLLFLACAFVQLHIVKLAGCYTGCIGRLPPPYARRQVEMQLEAVERQLYARCADCCCTSLSCIAGSTSAVTSLTGY